MAATDTADLPPPQHHGDDKEEALEFPFDETPGPGELMPIDDKISWLRMPLPFQGLDHINLYVLDDGEAYTLVDSGLATDEGRAVWRKLFAGPLSDKPVGRIVITHFHPDHSGLAGWLCEETGAPIWMTRTEFFFARTFQLDAAPQPPQAALDFFERAGFSDQAMEKLKAARWEFLWVDVIYNQDAREHAKALYYLFRIFSELGEEDRAQECAQALQAERYNGTSYQQKVKLQAGG